MQVSFILTRYNRLRCKLNSCKKKTLQEKKKFFLYLKSHIDSPVLVWTLPNSPQIYFQCQQILWGMWFHLIDFSWFYSRLCSVSQKNSENPENSHLLSYILFDLNWLRWCCSNMSRVLFVVKILGRKFTFFMQTKHLCAGVGSIAKA